MHRSGQPQRIQPGVYPGPDERTTTVDELVQDLAADLAADGDIDVSAWTDLAGLPDDMEALAGQLRSITGYARRWACQGAGFEPSRLCLLRPLAGLMDLLAEGFTELEQVGVADWADLEAAVVDTTADLQAADAWVVDALPVVA